MSTDRFPDFGKLPEYDWLTCRLLAHLSTGLPPADFWGEEKDEQRIAIAVCKTMGVTPEYWDNLSLPERVPWLEATIEKLEPSNAGADVVIQYHGNSSYSMSGVNGGRPVNLSQEEHNALKGFIDCEIALSTSDLQSNGVNNPSRTMRQLQDKFPGAVRMPTGKGMGYSVRVASARGTNSDSVSTK